MQEEKVIEGINNSYFPDVLGDGFNKLTLSLEDDYEGEVIATLVRRKSETKSDKAILYVHGFNDYFFQEQMAKRFNLYGYNFYALDLRKYGRSYLKHQKLNNVRSLLEYDEEIDLALQIIASENNNQVLLMGHSNGGLIVTNYAGNHINSDLFHGIICNSPFYDLNLNIFERKVGIPILSILGKHFPNKPISARLSEFYGYSIHKDKYGEWNYSLTWKPHKVSKVNLGFIRAIHKAQKNIKNKLVIDVPTLVMHSDKSIYGNTWSEKYKERDAVLNVNRIRKNAHKIKGKVTVYKIENGIHDLFLSKKPIREKVYENMFEWMNNNFN